MGGKVTLTVQGTGDNGGPRAELSARPQEGEPASKGGGGGTGHRLPLSPRLLSRHPRRGAALDAQDREGAAGTGWRPTAGQRFLTTKAILRWIDDHRIVERVFSSPSPEVVARSTQVWGRRGGESRGDGRRPVAVGEDLPSHWTGRSSPPLIQCVRHCTSSSTNEHAPCVCGARCNGSAPVTRPAPHTSSASLIPPPLPQLLTYMAQEGRIRPPQVPFSVG